MRYFFSQIYTVGLNVINNDMKQTIYSRLRQNDYFEN